MPADKVETHQNCSLHFFLVDFVGIKFGRCDWKSICLVHFNGLFLKFLCGEVPSPLQHCCKILALIQQTPLILVSCTTFVTTEIKLSINHILTYKNQSFCVNKVEVG